MPGPSSSTIACDPPTGEGQPTSWASIESIVAVAAVPIGVLGAVSVATACLIDGSPAAALATVGEGSEQTLGVEHPTGVTECVVTLDDAGQPVSAGMLRTARKLMDGEVFA